MAGGCYSNEKRCHLLVRLAVRSTMKKVIIIIECLRLYVHTTQLWGTLEGGDKIKRHYNHTRVKD